MPRVPWVASWLLLCAALGACGRKGAAPAGPPPTVQIAADNVAVATPGEIESGPLVSGTIRPERQAALRAEVSGTVLESPPEPGTQVKAGQDLVRFDASALREAERSARSALRSARLAQANADRDVARSERLAQAGVISRQEIEQTAQVLVAAKAAVADAASRVSNAKTIAERASVRAPFDGVVAERAVKAGDVVQPGTLLVTVIDPATMRLEAAVPAARVGEVRAGQRVVFTVTGYADRRFIGQVDRVAPVTDPATGQVAVTVALGADQRNLVGGLHADGRILTRRATGLVVPLAAIDQRRLSPEALRLRDGQVERVPVQLGLVDDVGERVQVVSGLSPGDVVLVGAAQEIAPGTKVEVAGNRSARR